MDLAVGADRGGADVWANQSLYASNASVGAPPDEFNQKGQNWGLPPMIPQKLREMAYAPWVEILKRNMKYAGALRIDHVMALFRLFWVPPEKSAAEGAYVYYPMDELMGVLALESQRNQCLVVGEDLGMVDPKVREAMNQWGILSYKVFYFERAGEHEFKPPEEYPELSLVTLSTHDLPTLSGYWQGHDIQVKSDLHQYPNEEARDRQVTDRVMERVGILRALERQNLLPEGVTTDPVTVPGMTQALTDAIHLYLARTPAKIQMFQFEDLLGQIDQVNLPGTTQEYPNWRRKIPKTLEDLKSEELSTEDGSISTVRAVCDILRQERRSVFF
jgi:(1->4)-alpha-D-glucan 1-alpha-D-glucosylmutase